VRAAGVRRFSGSVEVLELPGPRALRPDEVLIDVRACGAGNWDEFARTGDWDLGARPPMALGVEAATVIATAGADSAGRVAARGASTVLDYHQPDWPEWGRVLTGGVDVAANAARAGSGEAVKAVRDGGRLATITADLPAAERDITMRGGAGRPRRQTARRPGPAPRSGRAHSFRR
jgi:NADPH:quinone reductase-like Zn-dependent oxidoreductase